MTRLAKQPGERLDRSRPLTFSFDGHPVQAYAGDTVASALLAQGRRTLSRSFKYHRPRGELCGCGQCANSLVTVDGRPGVRACGEPVSAGMQVTHQNAWPSLDWDLMRVTDKLGGPFTPVGFYYKTFIRPRRLWPLYERVLRNAAGLGRLPKRQDEREWVTEYRRRHCDLLVIGGGVSGLAAAATAAEAGLDVVLCDEDTEPGGIALAEGHGELVARLLARATAAGVEILVRGAALGFFDGLVPVWQGNTLHQVRARRHVLATGAIQQPLVFHDNDLPGVMLSGGARRLAALYAVKPGERAVVATVDDRGIEDALALRAVGVDVAAVADLRDASSADGALAAELLDHGIELLSSSTVVRAAGGKQVATATVARVDQAGRAVGRTARKIECDLVAVSGGATARAVAVTAGRRPRELRPSPLGVRGRRGPGGYARRGTDGRARRFGGALGSGGGHGGDRRARRPRNPRKRGAGRAPRAHARVPSASCFSPTGCRDPAGVRHRWRPGREVLRRPRRGRDHQGCGERGRRGLRLTRAFQAVYDSDDGPLAGSVLAARRRQGGGPSDRS